MRSKGYSLLLTLSKQGFFKPALIIQEEIICILLKKLFQRDRIQKNTKRK